MRRKPNHDELDRLNQGEDDIRKLKLAQMEPTSVTTRPWAVAYNNIGDGWAVNGSLIAPRFKSLDQNGGFALVGDNAESFTTPTTYCGISVPNPGATYFAHLSFEFTFRSAMLTAGTGTNSAAWGLPQIGEGSLTSALSSTAAFAQFGAEWPFVIGTTGTVDVFRGSWSGAFETAGGFDAICLGFNAFRAWDIAWNEITVAFNYSPTVYTDTPNGSALLTVFEAGS